MLYESRYYGTCGLGDTITHHGIKGQKWGIRRYQNPDGTLTEAGKKRYGTVENLQRSQEKSRQRTAKAQSIIAKTSFAISAALIAKHLSYVKSKTDTIDILKSYYDPSVMNTRVDELRRKRIKQRVLNDSWEKMYEKYQNGLVD